MPTPNRRHRDLLRLDRGTVISLIEAQGLKRYWVAEVAGMHRSTLRRWLSGKIARVHPTRARALAEVLTVDADRIARP